MNHENGTNFLTVQFLILDRARLDQPLFFPFSSLFSLLLLEWLQSTRERVLAGWAAHEPLLRIVPLGRETPSGQVLAPLKPNTGLPGLKVPEPESWWALSSCSWLSSPNLFAYALKPQECPRPLLGCCCCCNSSWCPQQEKNWPIQRSLWGWLAKRVSKCVHVHERVVARAPPVVH